MIKTTPIPDIVDDEDEHYVTPLLALPPRLDNDKDDPCQDNRQVQTGTKK
jgi:hypothetical protein